MGKIVWSPKKEHILSSQMWDFLLKVNAKHNTQLEGYDDLYSWSIENPQLFWDDIWKYLGIIHSTPYSQVVDDITSMPGEKDCSCASIASTTSPGMNRTSRKTRMVRRRRVGIISNSRLMM